MSEVIGTAILLVGGAWLALMLSGMAINVGAHSNTYSTSVCIYVHAFGHFERPYQRPCPSAIPIPPEELRAR